MDVVFKKTAGTLILQTKSAQMLLVLQHVCVLFSLVASFGMGKSGWECVRGVEEALNQADPTRSCERGGKLAAGLIILISFTLWITVELDSRGELPEIDELFSPGPGKMHPRAFTPSN